MSRSHRAAPGAAAGLVLLLLCAPARAADTFSPGELARGHQDLEGVKNCTKCHDQRGKGDQITEDRCLDCHTELKARVAAGTGFHGRMKKEERTCNLCHKDHQGRAFQMIDWGIGKKAFDHRKTGFALQGKHRTLDCKACHEPRQLKDEAIRALIAKSPKRETYLGLAAGPACAACHFDEHRGQLGADCSKCHNETAFKPSSFNHDKSDFRLDGKHVQVECLKCHKQEKDPALKADAFPAPKHSEVQRFKPVVHDSCVDCHKDPHEGSFGADCKSCHVTSGWKEVKSGALASAGGGKKAFHDKFKFQLRGAHESVDCKKCHGPFPGQKAQFKGLAFAACTDCHADAHLGQLGKPGSPQAACDRCHDVASFTAARYEVEEHAKARFALEGAHKAVACLGCHARDQKLTGRFPAELAKTLQERGRPVKLSPAVFGFKGDLGRCESCHADAHSGQFEGRMKDQSCLACHTLQSFKQGLRFDHARDSRFPLEGKHAPVACDKCHAREAKLGQLKAAALLAVAASPVRWKPVEVSCAGCHPDPHAGQFAAGGATDCLRCHSVAGWKELKFVHAAPFTSFLLEGKHQPLACDKCHLEAKLGAAAVRRYKPLPRACEACHADQHQGAMKRFAQ